MNTDFKSRLAPCWPVLIQHGVELVTFSYSGSGDSGSFDDPAFEPELSEQAKDAICGTMVGIETEWQSFNQETKTWERGMEVAQRSVMEALTNVAEDYLASRHGGWENNEGGEGIVEIEVSSYKMTLNHREFVQTYHDYADERDVAPSDLERIVIETQKKGTHAPE